MEIDYDSKNMEHTTFEKQITEVISEIFHQHKIDIESSQKKVMELKILKDLIYLCTGIIWEYMGNDEWINLYTRYN